MTDVSQPRMARGRMLPAGILATALFALLAFAPLASATSDPVASGTTTITLNSGFTKYLKTFGIKTLKVSPAKLKGSKATFTVTGGSLDPTTGLGEVTLGGGLKFKAGKKSATVKALVVNTSKKSLTGKVGGKKVKVATVAGWSFARNGFGVNLTIKKLKLTSAGANALNKALGFSKGNPKPFLKNKLIAKAAAETQPSTVTVLPVGNMTFSGSPVLLGKLKNVEAKVQTLGQTTQTGTVFTAPILGGTISPTGTAGVVQSGLGFKMVQNLPTSPTTAISTTISLGGVYVDLAAKTATVEVIAESNAESPQGSGKKPLNLGNLGRSSIADVTVTGVNADPATRTVGINSAAVLQPISAEVLQGFVSVYTAYIEAATFQGTKAFLESPEGGSKSPAEAEAIAKVKAKEAGEEAAKNKIGAGEALGTFSFTAQGQ
jgi:hypothetical protein